MKISDFLNYLRAFISHDDDSENFLRYDDEEDNASSYIPPRNDEQSNPEDSSSNQPNDAEKLPRDNSQTMKCNVSEPNEQKESTSDATTATVDDLPIEQDNTERLLDDNDIAKIILDKNDTTEDPAGEKGPTEKPADDKKVIVPPITKLIDVEQNNEDDNKSCKKIESFGTDICNLIREFDSYYQRTNDENSKQVIEVMQYRLMEIVCQNGGTPIDDDKVFNSLRHVPIPFAVIQDGKPIKEIIRMGITIGNKVILKAKVIV